MILLSTCTGLSFMHIMYYKWFHLLHVGILLGYIIWLELRFVFQFQLSGLLVLCLFNGTCYYLIVYFHLSCLFLHIIYCHVATHVWRYMDYNGHSKLSYLANEQELQFFDSNKSLVTQILILLSFLFIFRFYLTSFGNLVINLLKQWHYSDKKP